MQDKTFIYRLIFGLTVFAILAILDYLKNPANPKRVKEYGFLFAVTTLAMLYSSLHDFFTYSISKDYFVLGKGIENAGQGFNFDVIKLALRAAWSAGLVIGAVFLMANNPNKAKKQLTYSQLFKLLLIPLIFSLTIAILLGVLFYLFKDLFCKVGNFEDFNEMCSNPSAFITVWGIHIGSYAGGLIGLIIAALVIVKRRNYASKKS